MVIPYIYIMYVRVYVIRSGFMSKEVIIQVNFMCITNDVGRIIQEVYENNRVYNYQLQNKNNEIQNNLYYVSSRYSSLMLISGFQYYATTHSKTDFKISTREMWSRVKIGKMYRLSYYRYDEIPNILRVVEFKYEDELNRYLLKDLSNLVVEYIRLSTRFQTRL